MQQSTLEPESLPVRPRLAGDVLVHPPLEEGSPWIIERDGRRYFRVGADLARLAGVLTGEYDQRELTVVLGHPWTPELLQAALRQLAAMALLDDGEQRVMKRRRIQFVPPFSVQFTVLDPSRILGRLGPLLGVLGRRSTLWAGALIVLLGVGTLIGQWDTLTRLASQPVSVAAFVVIFLGNFIATVLHEMAHGAVLTQYGGKARRMGFMLFYLVPAFFCDVSDGWRLPRNAMRVRVALAGIGAQLVVGGLTALASLAMPTQGAADALLLLACAIYVAAVVNIVPFVKFDGYLALMSHLDISDLREKAMDDARSFLARALFGAPAGERRLPGRRWVVPYGLACIVFPLFLVGFIGLHLWSDVFARMGYAGAVLNATMVTLLVVGAGREVLRIHRVAGRPTPRVLLVDAVVAAVALLVLTQVHLTQTVQTGYTVDRDGAHLHVATSGDADRITPGQPVHLKENGILWRPTTGSGEVSGTSRTTEVPINAFLPVSLDLDLDTRVATFDLTIDDPPRSSRGVATVEVGTTSLGSWIVDTYFEPLW